MFLTKKSNFKLSIDNLKFKDREIVAFLGENGSGKTTLIDLIFGNKRADEGKIELSGDKFSISAIFQESCFDEISIEKSLYFFKKSNNSDIDILDLLIHFSLFEIKDRKFSELSFGQKQRFRFVVAIIKPFTVLILDEIMVGLDYSWKIKIHSYLKKYILQKKKIILVSHDLDEVALLCTRVVLLENGMITNDFQLGGTIEIKKKNIIENINYLSNTDEV